MAKNNNAAQAAQNPTQNTAAQAADNLKQAIEALAQSRCHLAAFAAQRVEQRLDIGTLRQIAQQIAHTEKLLGRYAKA